MFQRFARKPTTGPEASEKINADLAKAARRAGTVPFTLRELRKTGERYPELVPVLIDWLRNLDTKASLPDRDAGNIRDPLFRSLMTPDAPSADVMALATAYLDAHPPIAGTVLQGASISASYHATEQDRDTMIRLARDRENGNGRVWIFEWLVKSGDDDAIAAAIGELDDLTVSSLILRELAKRRHWPEGTRDKVEPLTNSDRTEIAKHATRLLAKIDKAGH